jgi:hypothetical protein
MLVSRSATAKPVRSFPGRAADKQGHAPLCELVEDFGKWFPQGAWETPVQPDDRGSHALRREFRATQLVQARTVEVVIPTQNGGAQVVPPCRLANPLVAVTQVADNADVATPQMSVIRVAEVGEHA